MNERMFNSGYIKNYLQFLTSNGSKATFIEVLPAYIFIVLAGMVYIYMEKLHSIESLKVISALIFLPVLAIIFNFMTISARAFASSKKQFKFENGLITISSLDGKSQRTFSDMNIRYVEGSYIDFIEKANVFNGYALFGEKDFLERVVAELVEGGMKVNRYPNKDK